MRKIKNFSKPLKGKNPLPRRSDTINRKAESESSTEFGMVDQTESRGLSRRDFLRVSAATATGSFAAIALGGSLPLSLISKTSEQLLNSQKYSNSPNTLVEVANASIIDSSAIPKFENQLNGPPPVYLPTIITNQGKVIRHEYNVAMTSFEEQILPPSMNLSTPVWGYGGTATDALTGASLGYVQSSPGPTFEAVKGIPIKVTWKNNISTPYMFVVDPTIHWANPKNNSMPNSPFPSYPPGFTSSQSPVPIVTHLHGGQNQSYSDGGPEQWFTSDGKQGKAYNTYEKTNSNAAVYYYPNTQQPTTLWYHDHGLGVTRLNVMSGLAGFYLLRAPNDGSDKVASMLPTGKYEMPLVIQDRTFNTDGSLNYPSVGYNTEAHPYWVNTFMGNAIIVNGKTWPNMNVDKGQYRLRFLNGSNARIYNLAFSNGMAFILIGSDGGYLKEPVQLSSLRLGPAERADIIVDFSKLTTGEQVILKNTFGETQSLQQIMQFTANDTAGTEPFSITSAPTPFNLTLAGPDFPTLPNPSRQRVLTLYEIPTENGLMKQATLDGQNWDSPITENPQIGATEEWIIVNPTMDAHPIHIHLVQFQLVHRQLFNASTAYQDDWLSLNGTPPFNHPTKNVPSLSAYFYTNQISPLPEEQGWKDTIIVNSGEAVTIRMRFTQQDGTSYPFDPTAGPGYVWHCHLLEHEDNEMMRPYKVVSSGQQNLLPIVIPAVTVAAVAALLLMYYYKVKRKKDLPEITKPLSQSANLNEENNTFSFGEHQRVNFFLDPLNF